MGLGNVIVVAIVIVIGLYFFAPDIYESGKDAVFKTAGDFLNGDDEPVQNETTHTSISYDSDLLIGSFNIQVFGRTKAANDDVMYAIKDIVDDYGIMAIQEIRDSSNTAFPSLMDRLNDYEYVISDRLGRSSSKEQYAFIYDPSEVDYIDSYTYEDVSDRFEREPFIGVFEKNGVDFIIVQIHTKPTDAEDEIRDLNVVVEYVKDRHTEEDQIIILGDLNADCRYYNEDYLKDYEWLISDDEDTTTKSTDCAYDRIIMTQEIEDYVVGQGIDRFDLSMNLSYEDTIAVSDHYPVYAMLTI